MKSSTRWNLYTTNEGGWEAMLNACESARESIDLEQFIFITNDIGKRFIDVCAKKASEGVRVRFLWDAAGSFSFFGSTIADELKDKGIELVFFKTLFPSVLKFHDYRSWYFRNHKRTLVIDGEIGFTGSICVSDEMINWRDTVVEIEGPVVFDMQEEFERTWNRALTKKTISIGSNTNSDSEFRYITNYPLPRKHHLYKEITRAIREARDSVYITTPYFVPTRYLVKVLRSAAKRGVDVKIIIPEWSDHPIVDLCSRSFFTKLLKSGVRIYLYKGHMVHSKTIVIDNDWSTVGTLNMDTVSLLYNFEANIVSSNKAFTKELKDHFENDLKDTEEISYDRWKNRYWAEKISGFFVSLIRDFI